MNNTQLETRKNSLESVVKQIFAVGKISASDRKLLRLALFSPHSLSVTEQHHIERVYEELKAGRISIVE